MGVVGVRVDFVDFNSTKTTRQESIRWTVVRSRLRDRRVPSLNPDSINDSPSALKPGLLGKKRHELDSPNLGGP
ncbi:hypothetical protein AVEN_26734-1 [Araneus ventricosus]|uniref:Uncharacterized protein n=1 Tax=Araneus ventricosus TaxID=182803 RepID=A0A4Y2WVX2_ARAVE|nr:hypothetical protein AVEN_26734-1 [Araneus ventricosus]